MISFSADSQNTIDGIIRIIKQGRWARITNNTYCIKKDNTTAQQIRDNIMDGLDTNEYRLFVVDITDNPSWGSYNLPGEVTNWLKER